MSQPKNKKKVAIIVGVVAWVLLLGGTVALALLTKPEPEEIHVDAVTASYKFSEKNRPVATDVVTDLDYYGTYEPNPIAFEQISEWNSKDPVVISGLKNKEVQDAVNNRIAAITRELNSLSQEGFSCRTVITANYFNLLSLRFYTYTPGDGRTIERYATFDLNTGKELKFEDLFSKDINLTPVLINAFYDNLSFNIAHDKQEAERRLGSEKFFPNPADCQAQYCPGRDETYDSLRQLIADYDNRLSNIEHVAYDTLQQYLSGEKTFYLNSYGPAFVLSDGTVIEMELKDNIRYAVYLRNYRSADSLYENPPNANYHLFFTETNNAFGQFTNTETDTYLFDFMYEISSLHGGTFNDSDSESLRKRVEEEALKIQNDPNKFRYISAVGYHSDIKGIHTAAASYCVYETDKSYYDSTFRHAIVDGKNQDLVMAGNQPPRPGHYDPDKINKISCDNFGAVLNKDGKFVTDIDDILYRSEVIDWYSWEYQVKRMAYIQTCIYNKNNKCYLNTDTNIDNLVFTYGVSDYGTQGIKIWYKENDQAEPIYIHCVPLYDLTDYIRPKPEVKFEE